MTDENENGTELVKVSGDGELVVVTGELVNVGDLPDPEPQPDNYETPDGLLAFQGTATVTFKALRNEMVFIVKIKAYRLPDKVKVTSVQDAGECRVYYQVPARDSFRIEGVAELETARPSDPEAVWLTGENPEFVTFTLIHQYRGLNAITLLMELIDEPELNVRVAMSPVQQRLF